jgi:uncharacterized RDD family membrane protein YckC
VATPWRCLFASLYDALVLFALCFVAMAIVTPFFDRQNSIHHILAGIYLLIVISTFYLWFWMHGGQTIGMRAWRLKLQTTDEKTVNLAQGLFRIITAMPPWLGLGWFLKETFAPSLALIQPYAPWLSLACLIWILIDNRANGWRNRLSHTEVCFIPKKKT